MTSIVDQQVHKFSLPPFLTHVVRIYTIHDIYLLPLPTGCPLTFTPVHRAAEAEVAAAGASLDIAASHNTNRAWGVWRVDHMVCTIPSVVSSAKERRRETSIRDTGHGTRDEGS